MDGDRLATELLRSIKTTCKRLFIAFIIAVIMLFATNIAWLYAWNLPTNETTITQDSDENGTNNYIGNDGDINGKTND